MEKVLLHQYIEWPFFSKVEFIDAISKYNNLSTLGPNHISWSYLKTIIKNDKYIINFVKIANSCIDLSHWSSHFKKSISIIIPKLNKFSYNTLKTFQPIVLLNTVGKLIKEAISNRIQVLWNTLDTNIFLFLLSIFLDFIFLFFWISFSFSF